MSAQLTISQPLRWTSTTAIQKELLIHTQDKLYFMFWENINVYIILASVCIDICRIPEPIVYIYL